MIAFVNKTGEVEALPEYNPIIFKNYGKSKTQSTDITISSKDGETTHPANKSAQAAGNLGQSNRMCSDERVSPHSQAGPFGIEGEG